MKPETQHLKDAIKTPPNGLFKRVLMCTVFSKQHYKSLTEQRVTGQYVMKVLDCMHHLREAAEARGHTVLYYDVDTLYISKRPSFGTTMLQVALNVVLNSYNVLNKTDFKLKTRVIETQLFVGKKKVHAFMFLEDSKPEIRIFGFRCMRSDTPADVKQAERKAIELLLNDDINGLLKLVRNSVIIPPVRGRASR